MDCVYEMPEHTHAMLDSGYEHFKIGVLLKVLNYQEWFQQSMEDWTPDEIYFIKQALKKTA